MVRNEIAMPLHCVHFLTFGHLPSSTSTSGIFISTLSFSDVVRVPLTFKIGFFFKVELEDSSSLQRNWIVRTTPTRMEPTTIRTRCVHRNTSRRGQLPLSLGMGISVSVGMLRKPSFGLRWALMRMKGCNECSWNNVRRAAVMNQDRDHRNDSHQVVLGHV